MNKFERANQTVIAALVENGVKIDFTRSTFTENIATGEDELTATETFDGYGIFKSINSLSADKNAALRGDFKSTDELLLCTVVLKERDKFTVAGVNYDVIAPLNVKPTDITVLPRAVVRAL